jgi:hypothetical protein
MFESSRVVTHSVGDSMHDSLAEAFSTVDDVSVQAMPFITGAVEVGGQCAVVAMQDSVALAVLVAERSFVLTNDSAVLASTSATEAADGKPTN